jgi:hypothetical protein
VEILVGNQLAEVGSPYPVGYLAAHVVLSVVLIAFTGHALMFAFRRPRTALRVSAAVTFVTTLGATLSGTVFLLAGQSPSALTGMEALGVIALLGSILLIVWGGGSPEATPSGSAPPSSG